MQLLTLFDGLGSVLSTKEVADKAILAYTEKRENVGKWFEEAMAEGSGLMETFEKSSIDQGQPASRVQQELDQLRKEKERVDQLWLDAQEAKKKTVKNAQDSKTRRKSADENKPVVKQTANGVAASFPMATRPETEGKEASPPITSSMKASPDHVPRVAHTRSSSIEGREKDRVKVVKAQSSETVSRWLTDEYAELEEEAYKVSLYYVYICM